MPQEEDFIIFDFHVLNEEYLYVSIKPTGSATLDSSSKDGSGKEQMIYQDRIQRLISTLTGFISEQ